VSINLVKCVPSDTFCFFGVAVPPLRVPVVTILCMGPQTQVGNIAAGRIVTHEVAHYLTIRDRTNTQFPCETVNKNVPAVNPDYPVAVPVGAFSPLSTTVGHRDHMTPQSFRNIHTRIITSVNDNPTVEVKS